MELNLFRRGNLKLADYLLPLIAIVGISISIELLSIYFNANFKQGTAPSFCAINNIVNCDDVARTRYAVFLGIPLSVYGLVYYITVLLLSIIPFINTPFAKDFKNTRSYIFTLSTISVIVSLLLGWISVTQIHKICILCYFTYLLNFIIFMVSLSGARIMEHYRATIKDAKEILSEPLYSLIAVMIVVSGISFLWFFNTSGFFTGAYAKTHAVSGNILGTPNAKVVIREYTDFQCPFCAISNLMMHRLVMEVPDVQVIHYDFPLAAPCNPLRNIREHKYSCLAALYSRAAEKQGKLWEMNDLLFENQQNLEERNILRLAKKLNLDIGKLKKDAHNPVEAQKLKQDILRETKLGIEGTPVFFINNKKYLGLVPYDNLKKMVVDELKKTPSPKSKVNKK